MKLQLSWISVVLVNILFICFDQLTLIRGSSTTVLKDATHHNTNITLFATKIITPLLIIQRYEGVEKQTFFSALHKHSQSRYEEADAIKRRIRYPPVFNDPQLKNYKYRGTKWRMMTNTLGDLREGAVVIQYYAAVTNLFSFRLFSPRYQLSFGYVDHREYDSRRHYYLNVSVPLAQDRSSNMLDGAKVSKYKWKGPMLWFAVVVATVVLLALLRGRGSIGVPRLLCSESPVEVVPKGKKKNSKRNKKKEQVNGKRIGELFVSESVIGEGCNGTIVYKGVYNRREVAVKQLVKALVKTADKEINHLTLADSHTNIVRWFLQMHDKDFIYIVLELCKCNLEELLNKCKASKSDIELWKGDKPSPTLIKLMRDMASALCHLHDLGMVHRDIKPNNILIAGKDKSLCAKLADMGISKCLDSQPFLSHPTGSGSSGWMAPEQLEQEEKKETKAVDIFSLGCVFYYCLAKGSHAFGDHDERDRNIRKGNPSLIRIKHIGEAEDLLTQMVQDNPDLRPTALDVLQHPLFWSVGKRLEFIRETSDRIHKKSPTSNLVQGLNNINLGSSWANNLDQIFILRMLKFRQYDFSKTTDCLRFIRNTLNHYWDLSPNVQGLLGSKPEGIYTYFTSKYPDMFMEVYKVVKGNCVGQQWYSDFCGKEQ